MNFDNLTWQYDAASRSVIDANTRAVVCLLGPLRDAAVGNLIARAPQMNATVVRPLPSNEKLTAISLRASAIEAIANDLHSQIGDSLNAWHGEEYSVQKEHADLIKRLEAADARANAVLGASVGTPEAQTLRKLAQALLEQAQQIDGLHPYVITHSHRHGDTVYATWSASAPSDTQRHPDGASGGRKLRARPWGNLGTSSPGTRRGDRRIAAERAYVAQ